MEFIKNDLCVSKVIPDSLLVCWTHINGRLCDCLWVPIMRIQLICKALKGGGIFTLCSKYYSFCLKVCKDGQIIVALACRKFIGTNPYDIAHVQLGVCCINMRKEHSPHSLISFTDNL